MTDEQFARLMQVMVENNALLRQLLQLQQETQRQAPNYHYKIEDYADFDWSRIDATVEHVDSDGVAVVSWRGNQYVRRSAQNKFKPAIWFSRSIGKDENGENQYERLITFKELAQVEPLPEKVRKFG